MLSVLCVLPHLAFRLPVCLAEGYYTSLEYLSALRGCCTSRLVELALHLCCLLLEFKF